LWFRHFPDPHRAVLDKTRKSSEIGAKKFVIIERIQVRTARKVSAGIVDNRGEVTKLLAEVRLGRSDALDRLLSLVYQELRRIARNQMRGERPGHTLQPTALVHEAFLRLVDQNRADWRNRAQFFGLAAQLMRRILVDHARRRHAAKRGIAVTLNEAIIQRKAGTDQTEEILAMDQALARLGELDPPP
jgi:RNA polymerase sigma factor (TIGR02999 family)